MKDRDCEMSQAGVLTQANLSRIQVVCPALLDILPLTLVSSDSIPHYWRQVHTLLVLRVLVTRTRTKLAHAALTSHAQEDPKEPPNAAHLPFCDVTPSALTERLDLLENLLSEQTAIVGAIEDSTDEDSFQGRLLREIAHEFQLRPVEVSVLQFLVTVVIQPSNCALTIAMTSEREARPPLTPQLQRSEGESTAFRLAEIGFVTGLSSMEWKELTDEEHPACKDRLFILYKAEYEESSSLFVSTEVCKALMGWRLTSDDKLKLAGTKLLELVKEFSVEEQDDFWNGTVPVSTATKQTAGMDGMNVHDVMDRMMEQECDDFEPDAFDVTGAGGEVDDAALIDKAVISSEEDEEIGLGAEDGEPVGDNKDNDETGPSAFTNDLDYLHQCFEIAMNQITLSRQRVVRDMRGAAFVPSWRKTAAENASKQTSIGEATAKLELAKRKMEVSLSLTRSSPGGFYPRLELLCDQLGLDEFQKFVLVYLGGSMISPIFQSCIKGEDSYKDYVDVTVGEILVAYFSSFADQVKARTYFYKSAAFLRKGIVKLVQDYRSLDLTQQFIVLDRRVLETIVGLDKESTEISQGSHLYDPTVSLDAVVLPDRLKETISQAVSQFEKFRSYRKQHSGFDDAISYGVGLTLMFCGKSGTGKTMTANAIAAKLGKKLLLVNFPLLNRHSRDKESSETMFQSIFREAELSDAIIFFDECESLFASRSTGGSFDATELLTELERFDGIVFLATNRPFDLDEAMYRRINEVFEFKAPNHLERLQIWKHLTSNDSIPCEASINWESIAIKYELTGGFIKNAVISALLDSVGRNEKSPLISEEDILRGCQKQVRGALQMNDFDERIIPKGGFGDLVASGGVLDKLAAMINLEKARGVLFSSWGFDDDMRSRQGTTALFWGPSGTGRSRAAEAVGFELGKPLKVVDLPHLMSVKPQKESGVELGGYVLDAFRVSW